MHRDSAPKAQPCNDYPYGRLVSKTKETTCKLTSSTKGPTSPPIRQCMVTSKLGKESCPKQRKYTINYQLTKEWKERDNMRDYLYVRFLVKMKFDFRVRLDYVFRASLPRSFSARITERSIPWCAGTWALGISRATAQRQNPSNPLRCPARELKARMLCLPRRWTINVKIIFFFLKDVSIHCPKCTHWWCGYCVRDLFLVQEIQEVDLEKLPTSDDCGICAFVNEVRWVPKLLWEAT